MVKKKRKKKGKPGPTARGRSPFAGPLLVAAVATVAVLATLAPGVVGPTAGPGVTCDEPYHVAYGKRLVMALRQQGPGFFAPANIERNFPWRPGGPPVHPPLGNWILGWTHHLFDPAPDDLDKVSIAGARFAPALAFGVLVLLVGLSSARRDGPVAGTAAAAAVVLVPRVFAHAHLAALDTITALFFVAATLAVIEADTRGGRLKHFAAAGVVWGLAMLVRLHGLLLLPPVAVWLVWRLRRRAAVPLLVWSGTGAATLLAGWPWLWLAPIAHLREFLGTATGRQAVHVYYLGRVWDDFRAPWHYPLVMFVVALPLGLLLLGLLGAWAKRRQWKTDPGYLLVMGTLGFVLVVFAWPGAPVYDGVRLFLMVFPLWAVSVGAGTKWVVEHAAWKRRPLRFRLATVGLVLAAQGAGLVLYHPCQLSHYSLLVGGLPGAEKLGFEVTYWGDAVGESLLAKAAERAAGERVLFGPNLAPFQAPAVAISSPAVIDNHIELVGWDRSWREPPAGCRYGVFYNRKADLDEIPLELRSAKGLVEYRQQGVLLARLVDFSAGTEEDEAPDGPAQAASK